jgi:hypothetical protein
MRQRVDQQSAVGCPRDDCHHPRWSTITTTIADPTAVIESAVDVVSLGVRSVATLRHRDVPIRPQGSEFMRDRESKSLSYAGTRRLWTHHIAITLDGVNQGNAGSSALLADVSMARTPPRTMAGATEHGAGSCLAKHVSQHADSVGACQAGETPLRAE